VRGLVVAGLLSALMSSLAGVFNACSTLFTMDLYRKFRPAASQHQLVWIGRVATAVMVLIGVLWIPVIKCERRAKKPAPGRLKKLAPEVVCVL
jgi:SSS family solute:Na+ symporter